LDTYTSICRRNVHVEDDAQDAGQSRLDPSERGRTDR
jgi:hypothetical protein